MNPIKNSDIATLELSKLFGTLKTLADNNTKSAQGRGKKWKKPAPKPRDTRPLVERTKWADEAVVLLVDRITCQCCGNEILAPNNKLLLRRHNPLVGTHMRAMGPGEHYHGLPHLTQYVEQTVPACHLCFAISEALYEQSEYQRECSRQLAIDLG